MAHFSGSALYLKYGATVITADFRAFSMNEKIDTYDTTAGADATRTHVIGPKAVDASLSLLWDSSAAGSSTLAALALGAGSTLEIGPLGTVAGNPKYAAPFSVTGITHNINYDGEMTADVTLMRNGAWTSHWTESGSTY